MQSFPHTVGELILALDATFPEVISKPGDSTDKIFHAAGQRSVIHFIKQWRDGALTVAPSARTRGAGRPTR